MSTEPQVRLGALYPNSDARASGKTGKLPTLKLAADLALQLGMVRTWPNLQTIRLAIESEAEYSSITVAQAAALIAHAANEVTIVHPEHYSFQAATLLRKSNNVNRFWFEDALWRCKRSYEVMLERLQQESA